MRFRHEICPYYKSFEYSDVINDVIICLSLTFSNYLNLALFSGSFWLYSGESLHRELTHGLIILPKRTNIFFIKWIKIHHFHLMFPKQRFVSDNGPNKFFKGYLLQILLGPFFNTLTHKKLVSQIYQLISKCLQNIPFWKNSIIMRKKNCKS